MAAGTHPAGAGTGRTLALVTGASDGLGRAIALALAKDGMDLIVVDLRLDMLEETVRQLRGSTPAQVIPVAMDLRDASSLAGRVDSLVAQHGPVGVLINNAGVALRKPALEVTVTEWDAVLGVNLTGTFFLTQAVARHMIAAGRGGAILNLSSTYGVVGFAGRSTYGISKGALVQMTRMLAVEWAAAGVRVNALAPATVETPSRAPVLADPGLRKVLLDRIPLGRFGTVEDVAEAARYLCGPGGAFVTGQTLLIDGGLTAV